ncbi:beta-ketoacyl synthase N-terminal-like domain-containing protein [Desulfolithobacter sp.]
MSQDSNRTNGPVAIIGMACIFPQAPDLKSFWNNILRSVNAVDDPLPEWEADRYIESGRIQTAKGGYLKDLYRFDPRPSGIMPNSLDGGEPDQFLALRVAWEALADAGYLGDEYDHSQTGIILGHSTYLHRGQVNMVQHHIVLDQTLELLEAFYPDLTPAQKEKIRETMKASLPQSNTDIYPGLVPNVMTGRIANRLNLKGPNYLIDAACSSSLLALNGAIEELRSNRCRLMLAGGVNASLPAEVAIIFTELGALSRTGRVCPFAADADGTLLGEGLGIVVLKKLEDALEDGDRIYALIHDIGQSSDGRGQGLLAPSVEGETLAIERAYGSCRIDPATIRLVEAHGTGIPLGDRTEIKALGNVFGQRRGQLPHIALGSVKSMISHCIPAAGIAGVIKTALALHHRILPPTICDRVNPELNIETTPFYINTSVRPWISRPDLVRRAAVNAFGFGGINTHAIMEEAPADAQRPATLSRWPWELFVFSAPDRATLAGKLQNLLEQLENGPERKIDSIAAQLALEDKAQPYRLGFVASDRQDLQRKIQSALKNLADRRTEKSWTLRNSISFASRSLDGKLAFMFPGEGSQYLGMLADLAIHFDGVREWFDCWSGIYDGDEISRTDILFPPPGESGKKMRAELEERLHSMDTGSEAVFIGSQALFTLLGDLGVKADMMVGHSTGESSALVASGAIKASNKSALASLIKELNLVYREVQAAGDVPTGALLAVGALPRETVLQCLEKTPGNPMVAMDNCASQLVLFGDRDTIATIQEELVQKGGICILLPFDRGYHTPLFAEVSRAFRSYYDEVHLGAPKIPLYSCATADLFPDDPAAARELAAGQWSTTVRFTDTVQKMYDDGARCFIEVGPSANLSAFVNDILKGKDAVALPLDIRKKNSLQQFLTVLAFLFVNRVDMNLGNLFRSRSSALHPDEGENSGRGILLDNTMPVIHLDQDDLSILRSTVHAAQPSGNAGNSNMPVQGVEFRPESASTVADTTSPADATRNLAARLPQDGTQVEFQQGLSIDDEVSAPFLDIIEELDSNRCVAQTVLDVFADHFLQDHILSGKSSLLEDMLGLSCVPLMVSLEIMAEACALAAGDVNVQTIENIKSFDWIALDGDEITLEVRAERIRDMPEKFSAVILRNGKPVVSALYSFQADRRLQPLPVLTGAREYRWRPDELYTTGMFHGPTFQSIRRITGWAETGIEAELGELSLTGFFEDGKTPELILNPVLLDATGQLAAYWTAHREGPAFNSFPSTIDRIELYGKQPATLNNLTLTGRRSPGSPAGEPTADHLWEYECQDKDGNALFRMSGLANIFFPVPQRFYEVRKDPLQGRLGSLFTEQQADIILWRLDYLPEKFCSQSGRIFLRVLARALLSWEEYDTWLEMASKPLHRQMEWLFGRICIKEGVTHWLQTHTGLKIFPADLVVLHDEHGAPYVETVVEQGIALPEISLSHDRKMALAAVAPPGRTIGVDFEHLDRPFDPELMSATLRESEQLMLEGLEGEALREKMFCIWCAREAASKYFKCGLQGNPRQYRVMFDNQWRQAVVHLGDRQVPVNILKKGTCIAAYAIAPSSP